MPRPKGSKNKAKAILTPTILDPTAIEENELKGLIKEKEAAIAAAAAKKAEEDKQVILDAVAKSGKSIEEILEMLK